MAKVAEAITATNGRGTTTNTAAFEQLIAGVVFGDSREKGMVRGSEFVHPDMRFMVRFPEGWKIMNSASQVSATPTRSAECRHDSRTIQGQPPGISRRGPG